MASLLLFSLWTATWFILRTYAELNQVESFSISTTDDSSAASSATVTITLWFNHTILQHTVDAPNSATTYTAHKTSNPNYAELSSSICNPPRYQMMIENPVSGALWIDTMTVHMTSGDYYGLAQFCIDPPPPGMNDRVKLYDNVCGSGTDVTHFSSVCIDNELDDNGPYRQIVYFDLSRPNMYITNAQWSHGTDIVFGTCEPTPNPTDIPTRDPSVPPSNVPSEYPTTSPTEYPSVSAIATVSPTLYPSISPSDDPTASPSNYPSESPSEYPTKYPSDNEDQQGDDGDDPDEHKSDKNNDLTSGMMFMLGLLTMLAMALLICILCCCRYLKKMESSQEHKNMIAGNKQDGVIPAQVGGTTDDDDHNVQNTVVVVVAQYDDRRESDDDNESMYDPGDENNEPMTTSPRGNTHRLTTRGGNTRGKNTRGTNGTTHGDLVNECGRERGVKLGEESVSVNAVNAPVYDVDAANQESADKEAIYHPGDENNEPGK